MASGIVYMSTYISSNTLNISSASILNEAYPIGSIYMSVNNTDPSILFGGTWEALEDKFLLGAGTTYTAGNTGGAASVSYTPAGTVGGHTLTTSEIPSHTHTFTGSAVTSGNNSVGHTHSFSTGNQSAGHTHTITTGNPSANHTHTGPSHTHTGPSHTHTGPSHSHTANSAGSHTHQTPKWVPYDKGQGYWSHNGPVFKTSGNSNPIVWDEVWNVNAGGAHTHSTTAAGTGATGAAGTGATGAAGTGATGTVSAWHTHSGTTSGISANHTHSGTTGGISANHTHSVTASGTNASTGGGGSHNHGFTGTAASLNNMPPYLVVYMWKRVS